MRKRGSGRKRFPRLGHGQQESEGCTAADQARFILPPYLYYILSTADLGDGRVSTRRGTFMYRTIASVTVPLTNLLLSSAARYDILVVSVTCAAVPGRIVETSDHHARVLAPESRPHP